MRIELRLEENLVWMNKLLAMLIRKFFSITDGLSWVINSEWQVVGEL